MRQRTRLEKGWKLKSINGRVLHSSVFLVSAANRKPPMLAKKACTVFYT